MDGMNPITRREVFLAAASGDQVETPEPITREEIYLKKIAEGGGGSDLPDTPAEDGTYALQNTVSSGTSTLSWASGSSGGGVLVVTDTDGTLDKTAGEIMATAESGGACIKQTSGPASYIRPIVEYSVAPNGYVFCVLVYGEATYYFASEENDYPALSE